MLGFGEIFSQMSLKNIWHTFFLVVTRRPFVFTDALEKMFKQIFNIVRQWLEVTSTRLLCLKIMIFFLKKPRYFCHSKAPIYISDNTVHPRMNGI